MGCNEFGERALVTANAADHSINLVARPKGRYSGAYFFHDTRHVDTKHSRQRLFRVGCFAARILVLQGIDSRWL